MNAVTIPDTFAGQQESFLEDRTPKYDALRRIYPFVYPTTSKLEGTATLMLPSLNMDGQLEHVFRLGLYPTRAVLVERDRARCHTIAVRDAPVARDRLRCPVEVLYADLTTALAQPSCDDVAVFLCDVCGLMRPFADVLKHRLTSLKVGYAEIVQPCWTQNGDTEQSILAELHEWLRDVGTGLHVSAYKTTYDSRPGLVGGYRMMYIGVCVSPGTGATLLDIDTGSSYDLDAASRSRTQQFLTALPGATKRQRSVIWTPATEQLLGTDTDRNVAERLGLQQYQVQRRRVALRILAYAPAQSPRTRTTSLKPRGLGLSGLTPRQRDVYTALGQGMIYREVGAHLGLSMGTVCTHANGIKDALLIDDIDHVRSYAANHPLTELA